MSSKIKICFVQAFAYAVFNPKSTAKIGGAEVDLYNINKSIGLEVLRDKLNIDLEKEKITINGKFNEDAEYKFDKEQQQILMKEVKKSMQS